MHKGLLTFVMEVPLHNQSTSQINRYYACDNLRKWTIDNRKEVTVNMATDLSTTYFIITLRGTLQVNEVKGVKSMFTTILSRGETLEWIQGIRISP